MKKNPSGKATTKKDAPGFSSASFLSAAFLGLRDEHSPQPKSLVEIATSKIFPDVEENAPTWAKRAMELAVASAIPLSRKRNASEHYNTGVACGQLIGSAAMLPPDVTKDALFGIPVCREMYATSLPSDDAADFFAGVRDGEKRLRELPERAKTFQTIKAFRTIALDWREASQYEGNAGELHGWLIDKGVIHFKTDPAFTRGICGKIGFPKRARAGRPPEKK
jgi:hypothetical protein